MLRTKRLVLALLLVVSLTSAALACGGSASEQETALQDNAGVDIGAEESQEAVVLEEGEHLDDEALVTIDAADDHDADEIVALDEHVDEQDQETVLLEEDGHGHAEEEVDGHGHEEADGHDDELVMLEEDGHGHADEEADGHQLEEEGEVVEIVLNVVEGAAPWGFDPNTVEVEVGQRVMFTLVNGGQFEHDVEIALMLAEHIEIVEGLEHHKALGAGHHTEETVAAHTMPGSSTSVVFTPIQAGEYTFACTLPGHQQLGMVGTITVTEGA